MSKPQLFLKKINALSVLNICVSLITLSKYMVKCFLLNPKKAGGLNLCIAQGVFGAPPPLKKTIENRYWDEMHVHSPIFMVRSKKKIRSITLIVWVIGNVKKML